jgi:hypothetical protein
MIVTAGKSRRSSSITATPSFTGKTMSTMATLGDEARADATPELAIGGAHDLVVFGCQQHRDGLAGLLVVLDHEDPGAERAQRSVSARAGTAAPRLPTSAQKPSHYR